MSQLEKDQVKSIVEYMAQKNPGAMGSDDFIEKATERIMAAMSGQAAPAASGNGLTRSDYPLGVKRKDLVRSASGLGLDDITLDKVTKNEIVFEDIKIKPDTLEMQAQVAESVNRPRLADNLRRASELTRIPDARVLEIYNQLRPYRCTKAELMAIAEELENKYEAKVCASFVREAAEVYEKNGRLKQQ